MLRAVVIAGVCGIAPSRIRAEALPFAPQIALGSPVHPIALSFEGQDSLFLTRGGKRQALPARSASEVTLEVVQVASDAAVAVIRVSTAEGPWLGLLGGRNGSELLLFERADAVGDPGERRVREIEVRDQRVATGVRYEGVTSCGERAAWLDAKAIDPTTLTLIPARQPALPTAFDDGAVQLLSKPTPAPASHALTATASSTLDALSQLPRVPRALVDGDATSGIPTHHGELLTFRNSGLPIERLELTLHSPAPVELWWLSDSERGLRTLVPGSGTRRVAITPRAPIGGHCLALLVAQGSGLELRELVAYGALDQPGGVERAISAMVQDDAQAGPLTDQLEPLGARAAEPLAARWSELSARAKRRSVKVLVHALDRDAVRGAILDSARADDPELRDAALTALAHAGEPGRALLRQLITTPAGDRALPMLARPEELPALLGALASKHGSERPVLRDAIEAALRRDPARGAKAIASWRARDPSVSAQVSLTLALSRAGMASDAAQLAETLLARASEFADRYRLASALASTVPSTASDAWLANEASTAQEWMQRRAAFEALARRGAAIVPEVADTLSHDEYPRVRAATMVPLLVTGRRAIVDVMLVQDDWPLVRAAAALALARAPNNRAALETAITDDSARVRRAAVDALTVARSAASWPAVDKRARAASEALDVRMAAVTFAGSLCLAQARDTLHALAARLDAPDASESETELALEALRVLHDLGGPAQRDGASLVTKIGTPELATMWEHLPSARCSEPGA